MRSLNSRRIILNDSTTAQKTERHSLTVMLLTMASRLLGIVKAKVIGSVFGSGATADVINFTYNIPNNFRKLFAEGAMSSAYVPVFSKQIGEGKKDEANILLDLLFSWQVILFAILVIFTVFFGDDVIAAFSDFGTSEIRLGGALLPFFMAFLGEISLATVFNSLLQCHRHFFEASFSPLLFSVVVIFGIVYGKTPMAMAYSVVGGGLLQFAYSAIQGRRIGYRLHVRFNVRLGSFPLVVKRWLIVMYASIIQIIGQQVSYSFASMLPSGSVTAFSNATIFWQTPYGIFFTAISTVYFPLMSQAWAKQEKNQLRNEVGRGLEYLATFMLPSAILLGTLANECVSSVLQSGAYTKEVALQTAEVVRSFTWGMLFIAWYGFLQRFCYSVDRYPLVLVLTTLQTGLDIMLSYLFIKTGHRVSSLAVSGNIAFIITLSILFFRIRDVYDVRTDMTLWKSLSKLVLTNLPLGLLCILYRSMKPVWWESGSNWKNFGFTCVLGCVGLGVVLVSYRLGNIPFVSILKKQRSDG